MASSTDAPQGPRSGPAPEVTYRGRAGEHDYEVRAFHGLLECSAVVLVDGVECEPASRAEKETWDLAAEQGWAVGKEEGFRRLTCPVQFLSDDGELRTEATVEIRTVGYGGTGEVDVRRGFEPTPLAPDPGSASAAREERRAAHPTRFALVAALVRAAGYLLPLLGIGLLLSGLLRPMREWLDRVTQPPRDAVREATAPAREAIAAVVEPVLAVLGDLVETLFGWIPGVFQWLFGWMGHLPDWMTSVLLPALVVLGVFVSTRARLQGRRQRMDAARRGGGASATETAGGARSGDDDAEGGRGGGADDDTEDGASSPP